MGIDNNVVGAIVVTVGWDDQGWPQLGEQLYYYYYYYYVAVARH